MDALCACLMNSPLCGGTGAGLGSAAFYCQGENSPRADGVGPFSVRAMAKNYTENYIQATESRSLVEIRFALCFLRQGAPL